MCTYFPFIFVSINHSRTTPKSPTRFSSQRSFTQYALNAMNAKANALPPTIHEISRIVLTIPSAWLAVYRENNATQNKRAYIVEIVLSQIAYVGLLSWIWGAREEWKHCTKDINHFPFVFYRLPHDLGR